MADPKAAQGIKPCLQVSIAYVVERQCVLRYDNETGKGDHRHYGSKNGKYAFATPDKLIADFQRDIARWNNENRHS